MQTMLYNQTRLINFNLIKELQYIRLFPYTVATYSLQLADTLYIAAAAALLDWSAIDVWQYVSIKTGIWSLTSECNNGVNTGNKLR